MRYVDLQVNGYGGVDLNGDGATIDDIGRMCEHLEADGTEGILATIITDVPRVMAERINRVVRSRGASATARSVIRGIHLEGPFISPTDGYRGAHPLDAVVPANLELAKRLLDAGDGLVRIVTLAPECDAGLRVTRMLADCGVVVACGHSNASVAQLDAAIDAGLRMFTHVGNGCPAEMPRHDNIVQRILSRCGDLAFCFIADGKHIPLFALDNYLKLAGYQNAIVVTDAIAAASAGPGTYTLGRWHVTTREDGSVRSPDGSHFVGSTVTMAACHRNLVNELGLPPQVTQQLLEHNPNRVCAKS
jgi:N-acetylglucosamine-6-phosphate deacetylase